MKKKNIQLEEIIKLHEQGLYDKEIAEILGCSRSNITIRLNRAGYIGRSSKINNIELRNRISKKLTGRYYGENNPNFKGYINEKTLARGIFKTLSKDLIRNSNYTCQQCGKYGGDLETHHIYPFSAIMNDFFETTYDGNIETMYDQLTSYQPFMDKYGVRAWRVYGTPADSVKAYLEGINEAKPDVVISGINDCHNLGTDNIYSGTVGAAVEGFFHNIPSMAISFNKRGDISLDAVAAEVAARLEKLIGQSDVPQALNINFPNELKEKSFVWKWAAIGRRIYTNAYNLVRDDDGRTYYLVEGIPVDDESNQDSDIMLSKRGFVTVTPLMLDSDDKSFLASHHGMELSL